MESVIATEPRPQAESDQVCEPLTSCVAEGVLVELEGWEESPTHTTTAVDEMSVVSGIYCEELKDIFEESLIDWFGKVIPVSPVSPEFPVSPVPLVLPECPSCLRCCSSTSLQLPFVLKTCPVSSGHQLHLAWRIPCLHLQPLGPSLHLGLSTLRLNLGSSPPRLHRKPIGHTASPGSLIPPSAPWSAVDLPAPSASSDSVFPTLIVNVAGTDYNCLWTIDTYRARSKLKVQLQNPLPPQLDYVWREDAPFLEGAYSYMQGRSRPPGGKGRDHPGGGGEDGGKGPSWWWWGGWRERTILEVVGEDGDKEELLIELCRRSVHLASNAPSPVTTEIPHGSESHVQDNSWTLP
ncbi:unnamed protein product [Leuciscus chuanchicus]